MARLLRMTIVAILLAASVATAQEQWDRFRGGDGRSRYPPRYPTATSFDGGFNFCRLMYTSDRREAAAPAGRPTTGTPTSTSRRASAS